MQLQKQYVDDVDYAPYYAPASTGGGGGVPTRPRGGPADIIPFPIARRIGFLERMADCVGGCRGRAGYLDKACEQQRKAMRRRGLSNKVIESEIASFKREIAWRLEESV